MTTDETTTGREVSSQIEATLLHDAWIEKPERGRAQLRMQVKVGPDTRNAAMDLEEEADHAAAQAALPRMKAGLPVMLAGTGKTPNDKTFKFSWLAERGMPGEPENERTLTLGRKPEATKQQQRRQGGATLGILRQGAASILDTSLHNHEGGPEHLAAIQQHAGSLLGAARGGFSAFKGGFVSGVQAPPREKTAKRQKRRDDFGR